MIGSGKRPAQLTHDERAQLTSDIAVVLFAHSGQQPQEACRKAEEFVKALEAKQLPAPSAIPFMSFMFQDEAKP